MNTFSKAESPKLTKASVCQLSAFRRQWQSLRVADTSQHTAGKLRVAVLGTGALGKEHARIYSELAQTGVVDFTGIFDLSAETARRIAEKLRTRAFTSVAEAVESADALSIVTPTVTHFDLAKQLLQQGKHVLTTNIYPK